MIPVLLWNDMMVLNKSQEIPSRFKKCSKCRTIPMTHVSTFEEKVLESLQRIEDRLGIIEKDCLVMREHISFIEEVYNRVKRPLQYILSIKPN